MSWRNQLGGRIEIDGATIPEPEFEWLFYQALAGAWPAELRAGDGEGVAALAERVAGLYAEGGARGEAADELVLPECRTTSPPWPPSSAPRWRTAASLTISSRGTAPLRVAGAVNSLSQLAIKLAAPGVPDIYQGTEFWDLSFVDPDNRRPFGYESRDRGA